MLDDSFRVSCAESLILLVGEVTCACGGGSASESESEFLSDAEISPAPLSFDSKTFFRHCGQILLVLTSHGSMHFA